LIPIKYFLSREDFAYGDDTVQVMPTQVKSKNHLWEEVKKFIQKDKLIIGICNGCQIVANLGLVRLLPATTMNGK